MGDIIRNEPCPKCRERGHDKTGDHLMRFADGGGFCYRKQFHSDNNTYYEQDGSAPALKDLPISGDIQYSVGDFKELESSGKLKDPLMRQLALSGMRKKDRFEVLNDEEREAQLAEWELEMQWFDGLKTQHLVDRGIHGLIAKLYNVRVGHDEKGKICRHYYPQYEEGELMGATCRTIPKDFRFGHLGKRFGKQELFGMHTLKNVAESGQMKNMLIITGGQCDAMAAQQMLIKELNKLENFAGRKDLEGLKLFHVWSVNKGEAGVQELIDNKEHINQFKTIIWAFDNDETGLALNKAASKLFRGKSKRLVMPAGCKDPNDCLKKGRGSEFVTAVFNAEESKTNARLKRVSDIKDKAREITTMGEKYWLKGFNMITYGIRLHYMSVWGAGTGVGKTDTTMAHVSNLMNLGHDVVVIYLENQIDEVTKTFAGMLVNKDFNSPPQEQWEIDEGYEYNPARDYTQQDLDAALELLEQQDRLIIADLEGSKDVDAVMEVMEECFALGYQYFVVDNLTAFEHKDEKGNVNKGVQAIDATMKRLGTFKDENPVNIMLLSHLVKVDASKRIPHTMGGEVYESDFRGAGSITFWANAVWGIERNTVASTFRNKCITLYRNLKNRGIGHMVGSTVVAEKEIRTGEYKELEGVHELPEVGRKQSNDAGQRERDNFDMGDDRSRRSDPIPESEPSTLPDDVPFDVDDTQEF
ncbi:DNA helicase [Vibrio phage vB_ValA_R15Z]|nr:DNA helicase [Vibrio phage vB_ValA_R15Z]